MKYEHVNAKWPEGTREGRDLKPSPGEAKRAALLLWRHFTKGKDYGRPCTAALVRLTSGRNHTYWRGGGCLQVNPDQNGGGWHELVHGLSHSAARLMYDVGHDARHAFVEAEMIDYVVRNGWHLGALKRPEKIEPDAKARKLQAYSDVLDKISKWERKRKLAETKLKKYRAKARRIEREGNKS